MNVGAQSPEDYGEFFKWGEIDKYSRSERYFWTHADGGYIKYCTNKSYGYNYFVDDKTELSPADDAAYRNWGPDWRMPTREQMNELWTECTWTAQNSCYKVTSKHNGKSILIPKAGYESGSSYIDRSKGYYWTRNIGSSLPKAYSLDTSTGVTMGLERSRGLSVRAVRVQ